MPFSADRILAILALLFVLDAITTTIGLHQGLTESNPHARALFDAYGPHAAITLVTVGKIMLVLGLDTVARQLPYENEYRTATYSILTIMHVHVVATNVHLIV